MIKSILTYLTWKPWLVLASKITYKKPIWDTQPENYIYFLSWWKTRIKTGYRERFSFYFVAWTMEAMETLSWNLENLIVWSGQNIDPKAWKVIQLNQVEFPDEMIRVVDYYFFSKF